MVHFKQLLCALKEKSNKDYVFQAMIASMFSIVVCMVCLVGGTFAWFTATASITTQSIKAAYFDVDVLVEELVDSITEQENKSIEIPKNEGKYSLVSGKKYTVTLTASGNATRGFCEVILGDVPWHTEQIQSNTEENKFIFSIDVYEDTTLSVIPYWGDLNEELETSKISENQTLTIEEITEQSDWMLEELKEEKSKAIEFIFTEIGENIDWNPVVDWEDQLIYPNLDYAVAFIPLEGYQLSEKIKVIIDDSVYEVYTDGLEHRELAEGQTELPPMPTFDTAESILTIPAVLLKEEVQRVEICVSVVTVDVSMPPSEEEPVPDKPAESETPVVPLEPETSTESEEAKQPDTLIESEITEQKSSEVSTEQEVPEQSSEESTITEVSMDSEISVEDESEAENSLEISGKEEEISEM